MSHSYKLSGEVVFEPCPIVVDRTHKSVQAFRGTRDEGELLKYALDAYGHLLQASLPTMDEVHFSFDDFAQVIGRHYDISTPRTGEVVSALSSLHLRQMALSGSPVVRH